MGDAVSLPGQKEGSGSESDSEDNNCQASSVRWFSTFTNKRKGIGFILIKLYVQLNDKII
jgi:hypothetical protein